MKTFVTRLFAGVLITLFSGADGLAQNKEWKLEECIKYALSKNIQVQKANLTNNVNQLYSSQAQTSRLPSLGASVGQNFNWYKGFDSSTGQYGSSNGSNSTNYSVSSSISIYNGQKLNNQINVKASYEQLIILLIVNF